MGEMAHMFLERNKTTPVSAYERFGVALTAGYPTETAVAGIVADLGLRIGHPTTVGNVFSVGSLLRIYDRYGPSVLKLVLSILRDAYGSVSQAFGRRFLDGLALVIRDVPASRSRLARQGARLPAEWVLRPRTDRGGLSSEPRPPDWPMRRRRCGRHLQP